MNKKKFIKTLKRNQDLIVIGIVSIIAFIVGVLAIGFWKSFLIIGIADLFLFSPTIVKWFKRKKKRPHNTNSANTAVSKDTKKKKFKKICKIIVIALGVLFIIMVIASVLFFQYIAKSAPKFSEENLYQKESSIIYDIDGNIRGKVGSENREKITYDEIPEVLVNAILATEDSRFFQHNGFDFPRFLIASIKQVLTGGGGGASTLTMQLSKNFYTSTEASGFEGIKRKFTDIYMAMFQIEKNYSKEEIIEFYVNAPYLGGGAYGIEQACLNYFGKSAKDINLAEASLIAGLFQAPAGYDPFLHPEAAEKRRQTVLYLMERHGYITKEEREAAAALPVEKILTPIDKSSDAFQYQIFIDTAINEVYNDTGLNAYSTPLEIYTTMDSNKQKHIDDIMYGDTYTWNNDVSTAGIAVIDVKTGALVAVGGNRKQGALLKNMATSINRQIGSTSKPFYDYGPGIEYLNWGTAQPFVDEEYSYSSGGNLNNWDLKYNGLMTMRDALAQSRNIPALKAFKANKNSDIKKFVEAVGLHPELTGNSTVLHEAHSIGGYNGENPLTMAAAYATFANKGYYIEPYSYTKAVERTTNVVHEKKIVKTKVMSEETAYIMADLLKSAAVGGLGTKYANINGAIYGAKTGTSNYTDAQVKSFGLKSAINDLWVDAISPNYAISIWYGLESLDKDTAPYVSHVNEMNHAKLFNAVAKGIFTGGSDFERPSGVIDVTIEEGTYPVKLASEFTPDNKKIVALYKKGTEPTEVSEYFNTLADVTNLTSNIKDNTLTLSWNAITTPYALDEAKLNTYLNALYSSEKFKNQARTERLTYAKNIMGSVVYNVYSKEADGTLTLVKTVSDTSIDIPITSTSPTTYVVKSSYSIFKASISKGVETKISLDNVKSVITTELKGNKTVELKIGDKFTDSGIVILEDTVDVTSKATVKKTIKDATGNTVETIDTSKTGTYTITYAITYGKFTDTLTRTVQVKKASTDIPGTP